MVCPFCSVPLAFCPAVGYRCYEVRVKGKTGLEGSGGGGGEILG